MTIWGKRNEKVSHPRCLHFFLLVRGAENVADREADGPEHPVAGEDVAHHHQVLMHHVLIDARELVVDAQGVLETQVEIVLELFDQSVDSFLLFGG